MMPIRNPSPAQLQGFDEEEKVSVDARHWQAMRRQLIRLVLGWRYADKEITRILDGARHAPSCPNAKDRSVPCLPSCPDREMVLSALVIKHNASNFSMLQQGLPLRITGEYHPPSREYFDAIVSELHALRETGDMLSTLQKEVERGAAPSPWESPRSSTQERPTTRLLPAHEETRDEDDEDDGEIEATRGARLAETDGEPRTAALVTEIRKENAFRRFHQWFMRLLGRREESA